MEETCVASTHKPRKWYNAYSFPLIPVFKIRKPDQYNTGGFSFDWLFIKLWSLDAVGFEVSLQLDTHWGVGVTAIVPYLRLVFCIPCPRQLSYWVQRHLWRRPKVIQL